MDGKARSHKIPPTHRKSARTYRDENDTRSTRQRHTAAVEHVGRALRPRSSSQTPPLTTSPKLACED
eukprot:scaffold198445_cov27-Tisochrysis_lutea.AAC.1